MLFKKIETDDDRMVQLWQDAKGDIIFGMIDIDWQRSITYQWDFSFISKSTGIFSGKKCRRLTQRLQKDF